MKKRTKRNQDINKKIRIIKETKKNSRTEKYNTKMKKKITKDQQSI